MFETTISLVDSKALLPLLGTHDQHLRKIRDALGVTVAARENRIHVSGEKEAVTRATEVLEQVRNVVDRHGKVSSDEVAQIIGRVTGDDSALPDFSPIEVMAPDRMIRPRTRGQAKYVEAIRDHDLVFGIGPAGTGKTYLAVAMAVAALKQERVRKIVLVRPAVEAGESLGFLPGDIQAKINPYLRPLLDALHEMIGFDQIKQFMEQDLIEVCPLAYMRGRTLNEAFIILDEAQNTTTSQMKMFLTRMGEGSKIVVGGDITQVDLPDHQESGLVDALHRLKHIRGFSHVELTGDDIVRHRLVRDIVMAYDSTPKKK